MSYQELMKDEFDIFYNILVNHFPSKEVKEYKYLKSTYEQGVVHVLVEKKEDTIIAVLSYIFVKDYVFIDYFAVVEKYQGKRYGEKMLSYFKDYINKPILLEVELPADETTKRRISFYQRHGFVVNEHTYVVPPVRSLKQSLIFLLVSYPKAISIMEFEGIYPDILKTVYEIE
jgi:GNAT superfamily N-acetyltransferase